MKKVTSLLLAFVMCLTMALPAFAAGSLKFVSPDKEHAKLAKIENTNACVVTGITKPKGSSYTGSGLIVYDQFNNQVAKCEQKASVGKNTTRFNLWFDINKELNYTLTPGTEYSYQFMGQVNGRWEYSPKYSLKTTGSAPLYTITFDAGDGVVRPLSIQRHAGDLLGELPTPVWGGYQFQCWTLNGNPVSSSTEYRIPGNSTLVAQWTKLEIPEKLPEPGVDPDVPPIDPPKIKLDMHVRGKIEGHGFRIDPEHRGVTVLIEKRPDQLLTNPRIVFLDQNENELLTLSNGSAYSLNTRRYVFVARLDEEEFLRQLDGTSRGKVYVACDVDGERATSSMMDFTNGFNGLPRINSTLWLNFQHTGGSMSCCQFPGHKFVKPPCNLIMNPGQSFLYLGTRNNVPYDHNTMVNTYSDLDLYPWSQSTGSTGFVDVKPGDWFSPYVSWAVQHLITAGVGNGRFDPHAKCLTSQIITFLWNADGQSEPNVSKPFSDVKPTDWFDRAARWAYEMGIVEGGRFNGNTECTRSEVVTYLWKLSGMPTAPDAGFRDVRRGASYEDAVNWAASVGVTAGYDDGRFGVNDTCTRAQIATFISNYVNKVVQ